jgi:hypothetical protein
MGILIILAQPKITVTNGMVVFKRNACHPFASLSVVFSLANKRKGGAA